MKKLLAFLNTPLGVVIVVGAVALVVEFLFMALLHDVLIPILPYKLSDTAWDFIDAITLTVTISPALYFLVFRKIRDDEERFRQINVIAPNAIVIINGQGRITEWNLAAQRMFQYRSEEVVGQQMHQLIAPPRYRDDAAHGFARFEESGGGPLIGKTTEISALRKDGSEFLVELSISSVKLKGRWHAIGIIHDITERKNAETAFQTLVATVAQNIGAEFFRETVRSLSTWLGVECVIVGELVEGNRVRALAMQLDGKAVEHYEYPLAGTPCESATEKGYCEYHEGVVQLFPVDKDLVTIGAEAYVGTPIWDKNGKVNGILCAISRHKFVPPAMTQGVFEIIAARAGIEIERKLAEKELQLRAQLLDSVSDTIFVLDLNGNFVYLNEAAWKTRGYTRDEMMGINLHVLDTPKYEKLIESRMRDLMEKGRSLFESEHRRKDGSVMPVEINASVIELDGRKLALSIIRDITERKRMDEELQLTHFALDHAVDSVFFMEPSGKFRYVNETACRVLGYSREELLSMGVADIDPNLPEGVPLEMSQATKKTGIGRVESEHRAKDGHLIPVEIMVAYFQYKGEEFHCSFVRDITERKQMEKESLEAGTRVKDALENAIGAIAATLEQRDPYTAGHQRRVAELATVIGEEMGLAREVIEGIHFGGLIHDIGKISVPAEILGKPGRLTDIELGLIKTHAEAGYEIVKGIAFPWPVADMVRQHHERLDGSGYPQGLKGEQIVLEARILAVADVVEAMSANRPYRPGLGIGAALDEITRVRGAQLDPVAVDACLRVIKEKGFVFTK